MTAHSLAAALLDLVFSPVCLGCDGALARSEAPAGRFVCGRCLSRLRALPAPSCPRCGAPLADAADAEAGCCPECAAWPAALRCVRSAALLHPPADRLVHQLKYRGWHRLAPVLAARMARLELPGDVAWEARIVVPVPTTPERLRERGYNQAEVLARAFARQTGRVSRAVLVRRSGTGSQTTLQPLARAANVAGAFGVDPALATGLKGGHVLLVDDVLTTGATASECVRALSAAGVRCVSMVTFARALDARRILGF